MKLEKAIEILTKWKDEGECMRGKELDEAESLALEALKREQQHRKDVETNCPWLLRGETR